MLDLGLRGRAALVVDAIVCTGDARRLDEAVAAFGVLDVAVDVVGEARWGRTIALDDRAWDDTFDLVLRHAVP